MAGWFDENPYDPGNPAPYVPPQGGAAPQNGSESLYDAVAQIYKTALGREGSAGEINEWIRTTGGNLGAIQQAIYASPEAATHSTQQQQSGTTGTTTPAVSTNPLNGWDSTKWNDPTHTSPKYVVGRILSKYPPTTAGLQQAWEEIHAAYPTATFDGKDSISGIPGTQGAVDVLAGASQGGTSWWWGDQGAMGAGQQGSGAGGAPLSGIGSGASGSSSAGAPRAYQTPAVTPYQNYNPGPAPTPKEFVAPTAEQARQTPGYEFAVQQGQQGLERSAAAKGGLLSGGALKDITDYRVGMADTNYQNVWNNAFNANQAGNSNALNAYQAGTNANLGAGNLNLAGNNQEFQQNYIPSWNAYLSNVGQGQFQQNFGLAAQNQGFNQNLATNQFNLGAQNQYWNQGFSENQNAYNQYDNSQKTAFDQWYKLMQAGHPGNPYA